MKKGFNTAKVGVVDHLGHARRKNIRGGDSESSYGQTTKGNDNWRQRSNARPKLVTVR